MHGLVIILYYNSALLLSDCIGNRKFGFEFVLLMNSAYATTKFLSDILQERSKKNFLRSKLEKINSRYMYQRDKGILFWLKDTCILTTQTDCTETRDSGCCLTEKSQCCFPPFSLFLILFGFGFFHWFLSVCESGSVCALTEATNLVFLCAWYWSREPIAQLLA